MVKPKKYILLRPHWGNEPGTVVYDLLCYDYGLARDDTNSTDVEHISVTLRADGGYPSFTVPLDDLEETR